MMDKSSRAQGTDITETSSLLENRPEAQCNHDPSKSYSFSPQILRLGLVAILFLLSVGEELTESPTTRIMESVLCYQHYEKYDPGLLKTGRELAGPGAVFGVAEALCKVDEVQHQLAELQGFQQTLDGIPALLCGIFTGWAADTFGRKPVLCLGLLSLLLRTLWIQSVTWFWRYMDVRLVWLSALHALLGGGSIAVTGPLYAMMADLSKVDSADPANGFLSLNAAGLSAVTLMRPLTAWLMVGNPWRPNILGILVMFAPLVMSLNGPETLRSRQKPVSAPSVAPAHTTEHGVEEVRPEPESICRSQAFVAFSAFLVHVVLVKVTHILVQYISVRYKLTIAETSALLGAFSGGKLLLLVFILPQVTIYLRRSFAWSNKQKNLYLAVISLTLDSIGWTFVATAPNVAILGVALVCTSMGHGAFALLRGFLTSLVPSIYLARLYGAISTVETLGSMAGGVGLAELFKVGSRLGHEWLGLPLYVLSGICGLFALALFSASFCCNTKRSPSLREVLS